MPTNVSSEEQYNLLTGRIFMYVTRFLNQHFKSAGIDITREQWTVLAILWHQDGVSQQVLADATGRDKPSITRLLDNLQRLGYLERKADPNDRRSNLICLTRKGRNAESKVKATVETAFAKLMEGISARDSEAVRRTFRTIYSNIEKSA